MDENERGGMSPHLNDDDLERRVMRIRDANVRPPGPVIDAFDALLGKMRLYRAQVETQAAEIRRLRALLEERDSLNRPLRWKRDENGNLVPNEEPGFTFTKKGGA